MHRQRGFSLLEMMVVVAVLSIVMGAVFGLLNTAQQRYRAESDVLDAFQGSRAVVDQLTREVHSAGYPPANDFPQSCIGLLPAGCCATCNDPAGQPYDPALSNFVASGFVTDNTICTPGLSCGLPDSFTLVLEVDIDPENSNGVEWVVYALRAPDGTAPLPCPVGNCPQPNVLWRGVLPKRAGGSLNANGNNAFADANLAGDVSAAGFVPMVFNVMNDPTTNNAAFGNVAAENQKLFRYEFNPGTAQTAQNIRTVYINMIVQGQNRDPKTGLFRTVYLRASARRFNF